MSSSVLVIGYGNPGRLDDGLGPALAEAIGQRNLPGVTTDADYQLLVEDAASIGGYATVVFADAAVSGREPFFFREVTPQAELSFSSHSCTPEAILALAVQMYGRCPRGYALGIRGYEFEAFGERLSERAQRNLAEAVTFLEGVIRTDLFADAARAMA